MGDIPSIDELDTATLDPNGSYIAIANYYSRQSVVLGRDHEGNPSNVAENFRSGITDNDFEVMVYKFAERYNLDVIVEGEGSAVITGGPEMYGRMREECGDRFFLYVGQRGDG